MEQTDAQRDERENDGKDSFRHKDRVSVFESPPELDPAPVRREFTVHPGNLRPRDPASSRRRVIPEEPFYLIIGFDTEFKTPDFVVNREQLIAGEAKYRVLSYQFHAKTSDGREWQGICCPEGHERMTLASFIVFALGKGIQDHGLTDLPTRIILVGHFTRADVPAFADFRSLTSYLSAVRNTFISIDQHLSICLEHEGEDESSLSVLLRDTLLLTPQASRSLKEIGKLVGHKKIELDPDPAKHKEMIRNMDRLRGENWDLFKRYALNDATICVRYIEKVMAQYEAVTGSKKVPVTLTTIGIELLMKTWTDELGIEPLETLGKEIVKKRVFSKKHGHYIDKSEKVNMERVSWHVDFVTECYHGGRNEQFWFGPGFKDVWTDFDLSSAYPTAMSLIGIPDWRGIRDEPRLSRYAPDSLGFMNVSFEFPPETRFPTLPVRTSHGLVFPLKGTAYCAAPEIHVAQALGAKIKVNRAVLVPTNKQLLIFGEFIKKCIARRNEAGSKTLQGLFWKEISNSTYGKTAQGLRSKRVFDLRDQTTRELPPSRITNPFFAAFITSFTRAVLGEILNGLGPDVCVFSCTTDGFLTTADDVQIEQAQQGPLCELYKTARRNLTGTESVLEKKHMVTQPLGWRTRGQATLEKGTSQSHDDSFNIVLAKGGIFTRPELETVDEQNEAIIDMFFKRTPESLIHVESMTGPRDMVAYDADLVEKTFSKRLSMEFDWKRRPSAVGESPDSNHVIFNTRPWETVEQFDAVREAWDNYNAAKRACIKSVEDLESFDTYVLIQTFMAQDLAKYMKRSDKADVSRLRQMLCSAWKQSLAGLSWKASGMSARQFAVLLSRHGIPCRKTDVENGKKKPFIAHAVPPTAAVLERLQSLKKDFPALDTTVFVAQGGDGKGIKLLADESCPFVLRAEGFEAVTTAMGSATEREEEAA